MIIFLRGDFLFIISLNDFAESVFPLLKITRKTLINYRCSYNLHISPFIGQENISKITKRQIVDLLTPLSQQTQYQALMVLRTLYREAYNRDLIQENTTSQIKFPRIRVEPQKFLTWDQIRNIDFGSQNKRIQFLAAHGLRYGEAAALTKADISNGFVHINRSLQGKTKTLAGIRKVPLVSEFVEFRKNQNVIARKLKPFGVTVHSLRKSYAYTLKSAGIHVTTAAKLMGHSNPMVTLKIYTQVLDDEIEKSEILIRNFLYKNI